jgi:hypothetical protein
MKLMSVHSLLGRTEKMNSQQPFIQGNVAILKNRIDRYRELLFAVLALVNARTDRLLALRLRRELVGCPASTMRTHSTVRPSKIL